MEWKDKINKILEALDINQRQLSKECGVSSSYFSDIYAGRNSSVSVAVLTKFAELGISLEWMIFDKGDVLAPTDKTQIPILDIEASAGYGRNNDYAAPPIIGFLDLGSEIIKKYGRRDYVCVQVVGDSMYPTFSPSDIVVIAVGMMNGDGVYVINDGGNILIKRLQFFPEQDKLIIISDNHEYQPRELSLAEYSKYIGIVGRVICKAQMQ
jgi:phage repressor protein C with HTH and peptisase S24 domain